MQGSVWGARWTSENSEYDFSLIENFHFYWEIKMPDLWLVGIGREWSSYNELKQRRVVANGWSATGDLSHLFRMPDIDVWNQSIQEVWDDMQDEPKPQELRYRRAMYALLNIHGLEADDIVVAYEGAQPKGVCVISDCALYKYDNGDGDFEYANCLYPVYWIDININISGSAENLDLQRDEFPNRPMGVPGIEHCNLTTRDRYLPNIVAALNLLNINPNSVCEEMTTMNGSIEPRNRDQEQIENIQDVLENVTPQIVLQGPPGTSKTYLAKLFASHYKYETEIVQFHPSYNYEDFVRGIEVSTPVGATIPAYRTINRVLAKIALAATGNPDKKYVLIIDEINRANLAAVLGELIYALEYRGESVNSIYGITSPTSSDPDHKLTIPPDNLYIIGTMNTADRSIGHIDYAVRRRFAFLPMLPRLEDIESYHDLNKTSIKSIAKALFIAVGRLFVEDPESANRVHAKTLAPDFHADDVQPGHTYFMANTCKKLIGKFVYQVYPLLREYYKDGILIKLNTSLDFQIDGILSSVTIEPPISPQELLTKLQVLCPAVLEN